MERESERLLKGGRPFRRASVVWGGEAKNGSIPPTRGLRVGEREREREKERQMKNDTKCEREIFHIHYIPHRGLYSTSNVTVT